MSQQELTGYPHIDRPWMKYYGEIERPYNVPNLNLLEYLRKLNIDRGHLTALTYYGNKITYKELFSKSDDASRALTYLGAKKGSNIFCLLPNIPETSYIWLGASQIGAIADFVDPRPDSMDLKASANKILDLIRREKADFIVALEKCYLYVLKPIEKELKDLGFKSIVVVSANDSMNVSGIIDYMKDVVNYNSLRNARSNANDKMSSMQALRKKLDDMKKEKQLLDKAITTSLLEIIQYKDLVKRSKNCNYEVINDKDLVCYIGHTSGTSGASPKAIPLTNGNHISTVEQTFRAGANLSVGDKALHELPFFSPLGANNNFMIDTASGANLIEVPEFEIEEFGYLIKKYKPNAVMGTPAWISSIMKCFYLENEDLSFLKSIIYGGDSMAAKDEVRLNDWLKKHGVENPVEKGHGMSEYCGGATYARAKWNFLASMGIPYPDTIYAIINPDIEDSLVPVNEYDKNGYIHGELAVSSDAVTPGILHGEVIVKHYDMDGKSYIRTRDLVRMREDGVFFFEDRKDRSFTRFDGYKIKPAEIEKEIEKDDEVKQCRIVYFLSAEKNGYMPIAHITLNSKSKLTDKEEVEFIRHIVNDIIENPNMSSRQIPAKFRIRENMPLSKNSKIDYQEMIREGLNGSEITCKIYETNLTVRNIEIYKDNV